MSNKPLPKAKMFRENMGITQAELSEISGVSLRTIQRVELGNKASLDTARALASAFSLTEHQDLINRTSDAEDAKEMMDEEIIHHSEPEKLKMLDKLGTLFAGGVVLLTIAIALLAIIYDSYENGNYYIMLSIPIMLIIPIAAKTVWRWAECSNEWNNTGEP